MYGVEENRLLKRAERPCSAATLLRRSSVEQCLIPLELPPPVTHPLPVVQ